MARIIHLTVDVHIDGDEISGDACDGHGQPRAFRGWLGLIGALDGLLSTPTSADRPAPIVTEGDPDRPGEPLPPEGRQ